jgi:hypothetical protein
VRDVAGLPADDEVRPDELKRIVRLNGQNYRIRLTKRIGVEAGALLIELQKV